jgi:hypothetical protein
MVRGGARNKVPEYLEPFRPRVEPIEAIGGADPHRPAMVNKYTLDQIATYASGIVAVMTVEFVSASPRIDPGQSVSPVSDPNMPSVIFDDTEHQLEGRLA